MQCILHKQSLWRSSASNFSVVAVEELKNVKKKKKKMNGQPKQAKMLFNAKHDSHIGCSAFNKIMMH